MIQRDGSFYDKDDLNVLGYHEFIERAGHIFSSESSMANCFNCLIEGDYFGFLNYLDFSTTKDKAFFWSGRQDRVHKIANLMGWELFHFTPGGKILSDWDWIDKRFDWRLNYGSGKRYDPFSFWNAASEIYTSKTSGKVGYYYENYPGMIWLCCEKPLLVYKHSLNQVSEINYFCPEDFEESLFISEIKKDPHHSTEYLTFMEQISLPYMKYHSPALYRDIWDSEKAEIKNIVFERIREGDLGVIPALIDIGDERAINVCREVMDLYPQYSFAYSELSVALYKITGDKYYFDQMIKCLENGKINTQNNIMMFFQSEKIDLKPYEYIGKTNPILYSNYFI